MNILLYHFGYRGDILVVGQNFTRELKLRYPNASIDLMLRPRMQVAQDIIEPLGLYARFLYGEKNDFHNRKEEYDLAYIIDERVYPEGNLRTVFTHAGIPFRQHKLTLVTTREDDELADKVAQHFKRPMIATQEDMTRKWPQEKVDELWKRLSQIGSLVISGPTHVLPGCDRPLSFRESAALFRKAEIFVGFDSGLAHAAALVGTQTVLIPSVWPESWIAPTEYANQFIENENEKHISLRPPQGEFCGHYFCLRSTKSGAIARHCGDLVHVGCVWKKRWGIFKSACCFSKISVDTFYDTVVEALQRRSLMR
jgi:ADP-heptose:LPS heptosyltransferase